MVPISTLRETVILVIFGIVLVPIAAKRAQDAPGYWRAFAANAHESLSHYDPQPPPPALVLSASCGDAAPFGRPIIPCTLVGSPQDFDRCASHSLTCTQRNGTTLVDPITIKSRLEAPGRLTLRFRMSSSKPVARAPMTQVVAEANATKVSTGVVRTVVDGAVPPAVTTTSAANRERWTLIWMGTAITVVAVFMSFC